MARRISAAPPKSNIYALMLILTTIVFVVGLVINQMKLKEYNSLKTVKPPEINVAAMWSVSDVDEDDADVDIQDEDDLNDLLGIGDQE